MEDPNYDIECLTNGDIELKEVIPEMSWEEIQVSKLTTIFTVTYLTVQLNMLKVKVVIHVPVFK